MCPRWCYSVVHGGVTVSTVVLQCHSGYYSVTVVITVSPMVITVSPMVTTVVTRVPSGADSGVRTVRSGDTGTGLPRRFW